MSAAEADPLLELELEAHAWRVTARTRRGTVEGKAAEVAVLTAQLAIERGVIPELTDAGIWLPPKTSPVEQWSGRPVLRMVHPPIAVGCEYGCDTVERALELSPEVIRAHGRM